MLMTFQHGALVQRTRIESFGKSVSKWDLVVITHTEVTIHQCTQDLGLARNGQP
jgi:hypothetical protein